MKTGKFLTTVLAATLMALQPTSCNPKLNIEPVKPVTPTTDPNGDEGDETIDLPTEPASCTNKIVAHRGGSSGCGARTIPERR